MAHKQLQIVRRKQRIQTLNLERPKNKSLMAPHKNQVIKTLTSADKVADTLSLILIFKKKYRIWAYNGVGAWMAARGGAKLQLQLNGIGD